MILLNGKLVDERAAAVSPLAPGFMFGVGAFTTVRIYNPHGTDFNGEAVTGANDGFLTLTADQFYNNFFSFEVASPA